MDYDEDAIIGSRALDWEAADVDGISGAPLGSSASGRRAGARVRVPRAPPREGTFHAWLIKVDCEGGPHLGVQADASQGAQPSTHSIAGVCHCKWELAEPTEDNFIDHTPLNHHLPLRPHNPKWGYLQYRMMDIDFLDESCPVPESTCPGPWNAGTPLSFWQAARGRLLTRSRSTVREWVADTHGSLNVILLYPVALFLELLHVTLPYLFRSVRLTMRVMWKEIIPGYPSRKELQQLRAAWGVRRNQGGGRTSTVRAKRPYEDVLLELPRKNAKVEKAEAVDRSNSRVQRNNATDPLKVIRAVFLVVI